MRMVAERGNEPTRFEFWHWLAGEGFRTGNRYVLSHAAPNLALFAVRMIPAHNQTLCPHHEWFQRVRRPEPAAAGSTGP